MKGTGIHFAHLHLVLIHFPPVLSVGAAMAASAAFLLRRRGGELIRLTLLLLVAAGFATPLAYLAGNRAAEEIGRVEGIRQDAIAPHQSAALVALIAAVAGAVIAGATVVAVRGYGGVPVGFRLLVLLAAIVCAVAIGWAALLGGAIHHPEIGTVVLAISPLPPRAPRV